MPKKPNKAAQLQNYVPAGNGDASGEYADEETGSNIHFTNFQKPETEQEKKLKDFEQSILLDLTKEELTKIHNEKTKTKYENDLISDLVEEEQKNELDSDLVEFDSAEVPTTVEKNNELPEFEELVDTQLDESETKQGILNLNPDLDKDKVNALDEKQAKKLLKAIEVSGNAQKKYDALKKKENEYEGIWANKTTPSLLVESKGKEGVLASIKAKKEYFTANNNQEMLDKLAIAEQDINQYLAKKEKLDAKVKKANDLIAKYENPNNLYSQAKKDKAVWCKNSSETKKYFPSITTKGLTSAEKDALVGYTGSYSFINEPLRGIKYGNLNTKKEQFVKAVKNMTKAIDKSVIDFDFWTQRGTGAINFPNTKVNSMTSIAELEKLVGTTFEDQGFVSTGAAKGTGFTSHDIMLNIYCPKGTKGAYVDDISKFQGENELILQRGYSYKVTKVEKKNGKIYIDCDLLLGSDKNKYNDEQLEEIKNKYFI